MPVFHGYMPAGSPDITTPDLIVPGQAIAPERLMYFCCVLDPSNRDVVFR